MTRTTGTTSTVQLPADLAPSLALLHRKLHRSGRHDVVIRTSRSRYAC